ncbi:MotE family protein [Lichenicola sp.]|uniref:MotE family protein n=1 Tax=Lichenicola sp. TaxID=2804529 RepID=UPI003AFFE3AF
MRSFSWQSRVLPLTMVVIVLLFANKAVGLARDAAAAGSPVAAAATAAAPVPAAPAVSAPPGSAGLSASVVGSVAPTPAAATPAELQILQDLRKRRAALDDRARQLDQRNDLLQTAQVKLQAKLDELTALQQRLEQLDDSRRKRDSANWTGLVKLYEDMKPRDASAIFDVLDIPVLLEVLDRMDERKAASIMAGMLPERARLVTQMLAQKRTHDGAIPPPAATMATAPDQPG